MLERTPGFKKIAIRAAADGGTYDEPIAPERREQLCLDDDQLAQLGALAASCEEAYGPARDIEWAFVGRPALPAAVPRGDAGGIDTATRDPARRRARPSR